MDPRLRDAAGEPITVEDLSDDQRAEVIATAETPVLPAMVHGFSVEAKLGPYPPDALDSHRRALYVFLRPATDEARRLCEAKAADAVWAMSPLTPEAAKLIEADPSSRLTETVTLDTLREAVRMLRGFLPIPRQPFERRH